tara:strand:+ start:1839 stop:3227 length:1389 start_codon:yes stop_codon:yes gene_type:complete
MNNLNRDIAAIEESILAKEFSSIQNKIDELLLSNPDHPELLYFKGICLFHTNEIDESLNYFFKAKDLDTKNSNKYNDGIALVYKTTGDHFYNINNIDEARSLYNKGLEFVPESNLLLLANANIEFELKNYEKAIILYDDILTSDPNNVFVHHNLGLIYSKSNNYDKAKNFFLKAININEMSYKSCIQLAMIYINEKEYDDALYYLQKAELISPESESIKKYIIQIYLLTDDISSLVNFLNVNYINGKSIYDVPNFVKGLFSFLRDVENYNISNTYLNDPLSYIYNKSFNNNDISDMQSILDKNVNNYSTGLEPNADFDLQFKFLNPSKLKDFFDNNLENYYKKFNDVDDEYFSNKPQKYKYIYSVNKFSNKNSFNKVSTKYSWVNGLFLYSSDHLKDYKKYSINFYYGDKVSNHFNNSFTKSIIIDGFTLLLFPGFLNYDIEVKTNNAQLISLIDIIPDMDL